MLRRFADLAVNLASGVAKALGPGAAAEVTLPKTTGTEVYDLRIEKVRLETTALGVPKEFYVYTPPGYAASPARRYPVLYLFRGHEKEWIDKGQDPTRAGRNVIDVYEDLLAAGTVGPMILVFPGITSSDNSVPGMLTNFNSPS
jgi:enterochelin esterase-like enzyme